MMITMMTVMKMIQSLSTNLMFFNIKQKRMNPYFEELGAFNQILHDKERKTNHKMRAIRKTLIDLIWFSNIT